MLLGNTIFLRLPAWAEAAATLCCRSGHYPSSGLQSCSRSSITFLNWSSLYTPRKCRREIRRRPIPETALNGAFFYGSLWKEVWFQESRSWSSAPNSMSGDCLFQFPPGPEAGSSLSKLAEKDAMVPVVLDEDKKNQVNRYPAKVCLQTELSLGQIILLGNSQSMCLNTTDPGVCCDV